MAKINIVPRQKVAMKRLCGIVGKKTTKTQALIDAGYSKSYAESGNINKTKSWNAIMERNFSDDFLAETHKKLLESKNLKQTYFNYKMKDAEIKKIIEDEGYTFIGTKRFMTTAAVFYSIPDGFVIKNALDMAYKLKSKYGATTIRHEFGELSDAELEEELARELSENLGA